MEKDALLNINMLGHHWQLEFLLKMKNFAVSLAGSGLVHRSSGVRPKHKERDAATRLIEVPGVTPPHARVTAASKVLWWKSGGEPATPCDLWKSEGSDGEVTEPHLLNLDLC